MLCFVLLFTTGMDTIIIIIIIVINIINIIDINIIIINVIITIPFYYSYRY